MDQARFSCVRGRTIYNSDKYFRGRGSLTVSKRSLNLGRTYFNFLKNRSGVGENFTELPLIWSFPTGRLSTATNSGLAVGMFSAGLIGLCARLEVGKLGSGGMSAARLAKSEPIALARASIPNDGKFKTRFSGVI